MRWYGALVGAALLFAPQDASAWVGEPLCALPEVLFESSELSDEAMGVCGGPSTPHVVRSPSFDVWPMSGRESAEDAPVSAARALKRARELEASGLYEDALLNLRVVEATMPRIADYVALMRAALHDAQNEPARAAQAYRDAMQRGQNADLAARAQVGYVQSLLRAQDPHAERELDGVLRRYPFLPEAPELKLEQARYREASGMLKTAAATYRMLDLTLPGYPVAKRARERLASLAAQGVKIAPYTDLEAITRTERLLKSGPIELAREAVAELLARQMSKLLLKQRDLIVQTLAEIEGRVGMAVMAKPLLTAGFPTASPRDQLERRLTLQIGDTKKLAKLRPAMIYQLLVSASEAHLSALSDVLVHELARRPLTSPAEVRFDALAVAAGSASDAELVALADTLLEHPTFGAAARYHRARALERQGRLDEARADLELVMTLDTSAPRFYANWADQRLRALAEQGVSVLNTATCDAPGRATACNRERIEAALAALEAGDGLDVEGAIARLAPLAAQYGEGYPWLPRALDLLRIGEIAAASDELHETYLAFRFVTRRGALRAGREAVYRGAAVMRPVFDMQIRRQRLGLDENARLELARIASAIGDWGTATYFGGPGWAETHPQPYGAEVARAARKYELDPDLLFAVMRVESVYARRIISHAGAIGLMQIMPRTGRLIADKLGQQQSTTTDLLDARTNLEYSAWYLRSLLDRMDGRLPLAIASYNGGPHNVRKWIRTYGSHVPLDAFLERIPFAETKRYVRRVLGYYARYKAQRGQKIDLMAVTLPGERPSEIAF